MRRTVQTDGWTVATVPVTGTNIPHETGTGPTTNIDLCRKITTGKIRPHFYLLLISQLTHFLCVSQSSNFFARYHFTTP